MSAANDLGHCLEDDDLADEALAAQLANEMHDADERPAPSKVRALTISPEVAEMTDEEVEASWKARGRKTAGLLGPAMPLPAPPPAPPWAAHVTPCEARWFTETPPTREWLIRDSRTALSNGVIPLGKVGLVLGEGGVSKTMVLIALAIAKATGTPWLGVFALEKPGRVLVLLGEEDHEEVIRRSFNTRRSSGAPVPADGMIVFVPLAGIPCAMVETDERGNMQDAPFLIWLLAYVKQHGPFDLVIIDPVSRVAGAEAETNNAAGTRFMQSLEAVANASKATILAAHHTNKTSRVAGATLTSASARGSSAFTDGARWVATLAAERVDMGDGDAFADLAETVTFAVVKSNYSKKAEPLVLRRDSENGGALIPLDRSEVEIISRARQATDPAARRREARGVERETRAVAVDAALRGVLEARPGIGTRELRAALAARLGGCSAEHVAEAIERAGQLIRREPGPGRNVRHFLETSS